MYILSDSLIMPKIRIVVHIRLIFQVEVYRIPVDLYVLNNFIATPLQ